MARLRRRNASWEGVDFFGIRTSKSDAGRLHRTDFNERFGFCYQLERKCHLSHPTKDLQCLRSNALVVASIRRFLPHASEKRSSAWAADATINFRRSYLSVPFSLRIARQHLQKNGINSSKVVLTVFPYANV